MAILVGGSIRLSRILVIAWLCLTLLAIDLFLLLKKRKIDAQVVRTDRILEEITYGGYRAK
jgi:hypothetical protein